MNYSPPQERRTAQPHHPEVEAEASPHEIKYRQDAANYVAAMLAELRQIAGKAGFEKLVGALDTAYYEAYGVMDARAKPAPAAPHEKIAKSVEPTGQ